MGYPEFRVVEEALEWDPAEVAVPPVPDGAVYAPGVDPIGILVDAVMPTIAAEVSQQVANNRAREERFAENLRSARSAYHGTDSAGQAQIDSAASNIDPDNALGGSTPSETSSASSPPSDAGFSQLTQLMGMAMQVGQQAVQTPMQAAGMAGEMAQPIAQGVQGMVQQATQGAEKPRDVAERETVGSGPSSDHGSETAADTDRPDREQEARDDRDEAEKPAESLAGSETRHSPQAPIDPGRTEQMQPFQPRQMTETSPEVVL